MKTDVSPGTILGTSDACEVGHGLCSQGTKAGWWVPSYPLAFPHSNCDPSKSSVPNSPLPSTTPSCDRFWSQSKPVIFIHIAQEVWEPRKWPRFRLLGQEVCKLQSWEHLFIVSVVFALNQNANVIKLIFTCNSKCPDTISRDWGWVKGINLLQWSAPQYVNTVTWSWVVQEAVSIPLAMQCPVQTDKLN